MELANFSPENFKALGRSLELSMSLAEILMLKPSLEKMSNEECQEVVSKMNQSLLPSDYRPSQNRTIILMASMCAF